MSVTLTGLSFLREDERHQADKSTRKETQLYSFKQFMAENSDIGKLHDQRESKSCLSILLKPDYWHLFVLFGFHAALQFALTIYMLTNLPQEDLAKMPVPTSLEAAQ